MRKSATTETVSFVGSQFVGLRINGHSVEPVLDRHPFPPKPVRNGSAKNGKSAKSEVSSFHHKDVRKLAADQSRRITRHPHAPDWAKRRYGWLESANDIDSRGHLLCSLVKEIRGSEPEDTFGHVIHVPGFGNIFLAEVTVYHGAYHLTMLRAEMGCASSGTISMACRRHEWQNTALVASLLSSLLFVSSCRRSQLPPDRELAAVDKMLQSGYLAQAQSRAESARRLFRDPAWTTRFRIEEAKIHLYRGQNSEAIQLLTGAWVQNITDRESGY